MHSLWVRTITQLQITKSFYLPACEAAGPVACLARVVTALSSEDAASDKRVFCV